MARIVTSDFLAGLTTGYRALFNKTLGETTADYQDLCTVVPSTHKSEDYSWLGALPGMREWVGERTLSGLRNYHYEIINKKWELTVPVEREAMEDDQLDMIRPRIAAMGMRARQHPDELLTDLLNGAFTQTCYDGQYFCCATHSEGDSGTQVNNETHKVDASGYLAAAYAGMTKIKDDRGKRLGIRPNMLVVSAVDEIPTRNMLSSGITISGTTLVGNALNQMFTLKVLPGLTDHYWFLLDTRQPVRPLIYQERIPPQFDSVTDPASESVFRNDTFLFGARSRDNMGYGLWQCGFGSTGAA